MSQIGDAAFIVALGWRAFTLTHRASSLGIVLMVEALGLVATLLIGGVVADRMSRRTVMVASDLARVLTQGLIAALLIVGTAEVWMLAVLAGLTGAAGGFFNPAVSA